MIRKQVDDEDLRSSTTESTNMAESFVVASDEQKLTATTNNAAPTSSGGVVNVAQRKELSFTEDELDPSESEDVASVSVQQDQNAGEQILPIETLNVEISTAADLDNVYFEIATIKSPYSFQARSLDSTLIFK